MSYTITSPCYNCSKKDSCTDHYDLNKAVQEVIHTKSFVEGHKGSGYITLTCTVQNKE